jgi:hypothetical protein
MIIQSTSEDIIKSATTNLDICQFYDLSIYDFNMESLYQKLKVYLTNRFGNNKLCFDFSERLVFHHYDHDFYLNKEFPGLTLYNLQLILKELGIPNYFCRIVTNLPNYSKYTQLAQQILTSDPCAITPITTSYFHINEINDIDLNIKDIDRPFVVGSRLSRFHRTIFVAKLFANNLQNKGYVNYYNIKDPHDFYNDFVVDPIKSTTPCHFIYSVPFTRSNSDVVLRSNKNQNLVKDFQKTVLSFNNLKDDDLSDKTYAAKYHQGVAFQKALVYVGLESVIDCPEVFLNQISFKGIQIKRPFIIFGCLGTINHLQNLGFKTFSEFWDEGYDFEEDIESRIDKILNILENLASMTVSDWQDMLLKMQPILEYNFNHYRNTFPEQEFSKISKGL